MRQEFRAVRRWPHSALFVTAKRLAVGCLAVLHVLLLLLPRGRAVSSPVPAKPIAPPRRTHGAWSLSSFRDFVDARLGPPSCPVVWWALEGQLTSPTTGDVIAEVRGLEVVRCVGRGGLGGKKKKKGDGSAVAYAGLSTEGCLSSSSAGREVEAYATAVSRRAFLYLDPVTKQPMTSFRMSRRSKARDVPLPPPLVRVLTFALVSKKRRSSSQGGEQGQQQQRQQQQDVTSSRVMTLVSERLAGGETVAVGGGTRRRRACWLAGWLAQPWLLCDDGWVVLYGWMVRWTARGALSSRPRGISAGRWEGEGSGWTCPC